MVDKPKLKRVAPAPSPDGYPTLKAWLKATLDRHGMGAELTDWCGVPRQNLYKWETGSIPAGPKVRKDIAEWAQVPYESLRELIERDELQRPAPTKRAGVKKKKGKLKLVQRR